MFFSTGNLYTIKKNSVGPYQKIDSSIYDAEKPPVSEWTIESKAIADNEESNIEEFESNSEIMLSLNKDIDNILIQEVQEPEVFLF